MEWHLCCPDVQLKRPRNYLAEKQTTTSDFPNWAGALV